MAARSPYDWPMPELSKPTYRPRRRLRHSASKVRIHDEAVLQHKSHYELVSPAYLSFHTFSVANSSNARTFRDLSRQHQRNRIPQDYAHLIDWQFVMASPPDSAQEVWAQLEAEQAEHGDLLLVDEMQAQDERMPENMNDGKTYKWMQEVVKRSQDGRGRQALWVMKTDADTYHILPNLLNFLEAYDPKNPTFFGSSYGISYTPNAYFQGLGYGFSWGLLRTLVDANIPRNLTIGHEDHVTGSWMWSLPALPERHQAAGLARSSKATRLDPTSNIMTFVPPTPSPYTGLVRADFYGRASSWFYWWIPKTESMILTHGMKTKQEYLEAQKWVDDLWVHPKWIGQSAHTQWEWQPPTWMYSLAEKGRSAGMV
ncbi:hypothetical protein NliqN6_6128 [Naganishia liquefaciens]|uniref:Hexosyltransferase n=1 Tax=Naganishia liquefaciens TaxID=104408 RepID=A0A8H3YJP4_9TREE|nr:hypothetical protein NliqN6_6128 [Naganishia liquefaciens]